MDRTTPINEESAAAALEAVNEPVTQNLLMLAVAEARMQFMRATDQTGEDWERSLPTAPFDMNFFVRVLAKVFARHDILRAVLDGRSIEEATGWKI